MTLEELAADLKAALATRAHLFEACDAASKAHLKLVNERARACARVREFSSKLLQQAAGSTEPVDLDFWH